jgi:hypothetical protein
MEDMRVLLVRERILKLDSENLFFEHLRGHFF